MVANPTLRFNLANPKASTRLHDLSHIIHVDTKGATMSHIPLDRHPANNGHLTNLMVVSGSKMVDPDGTKINGTNLGPRIRNRDSTGSLLSLWERYPTDLLSILVQAATHRFLWFQILLNNLVVTWWFSAGLMVSQRAHGCYNNFLAPFARSFAWEIDPEALLIAQHDVPDVVCRGDFLDDEPQDVAQTVHDFNTDGKVRVVFLGAPPCPDFSIHQRGRCPRQSRPRRTESQAVVVDAADYQVVSRPRLWWSRTPWTSQTHHPFTNQPLQWSKNQKLYRLHVGEPPQDLSTIQTDGLSFHQAVVNRQKILPCFTTPAPSESGRPAPKKLKGRIDPATKARWLADQRTFAPWQYSPEAMMHSENGLMVIPPADVKEQCHQLPKGYTQLQGVSERTRHRLLANGWHAGVARFMLYMVVMTLQAQPLSAIPCPPRTSTLQWVVEELARFPPRVGPGGWPMQPNSIPPADDMWQHGATLPDLCTHYSNLL